MKINFARKFIAMFFTFCMAVPLMSVSVFAAESDTNITEINLENVSNGLWSHKEVPFATVDASSNYTIENQKWYSVGAGEITPSSTSRNPKAKEDYSFIITLKTKDGYIFPIKSESNVFYDGIFKVNGPQYDDAVATVTSEGKMLTATLFTFTKVKEITDPSDKIINTTVRDNYTDYEVTDDINLKKGSDYIIDFTKEDNLSKALISMADLEETKYYKFANSDNDSLIETEDASEALIKIVGNKSENKATMTLLNDIKTNVSYQLSFMRTKYTGSKFTYLGSEIDEKTGKVIFKELRDDYYARYHFNCKLNLIASSETPSPSGSGSSRSSYKIIEGENSSWIQNTDETLIFRSNGDFSKFIGIKINDSWVNPENYTASPGSTVVTLKNEYLKTLSEGTHKITFIFKNGKCSTNFEVKKAAEEIKENSKEPIAEEKEKEKYSEKSSSPKTGDKSDLLLWIPLLSASFFGVLEMAICCRKKELINL